MATKSIEDFGKNEWPDDIRLDFDQNNMSGSVGQELLSETEEVRVWRISLAPGERIGFHRHVLNYFWTATSEGRSLSRYADGSETYTDYYVGMTRHYQFSEGEFMVHDLQNVGGANLSFLTVELKNSPNAPLHVRL